MRKTLLYALVIGASVFTVSAFAQANLGGAVRGNAGVHAGVAAPGAMHAADQATPQTERTLHRTDSHVKHQTRKARDHTPPTSNDNAHTHPNPTTHSAHRLGPRPHPHRPTPPTPPA